VKVSNLIIKDHVNKLHINKRTSKKFFGKQKKILNQINSKIINSEKFFAMFNSNFELSFKLKELKKFKKFNTIVIIGMGGSILGAEAINNFLVHKIKKKIYFLNDLNIEKLFRLKQSLQLNKTLFLVISKSGNTTETLSNFFYLNIIKKNSKNIIVISEKKNNILYNISKKFNLHFIEHKDYIGGRYSVLSEVGLIPAYLMGLNIVKLRKRILSHLIHKNHLIETALSLANIFQQKKIQNLVFLNYTPYLDKFLYWLQQLIAESLGKKKQGFLPTVSTVPKDHHSLLQLYLDGPKDKLFLIFSTKEKSTKKLNLKKYIKKRFYLKNKRLEQIKSAQKKAVLSTFIKNKISFKEFTIKIKDEETLGELFSFFILNTILIGKLNNINPFDQPAVEQVKKITKKILS
tara:strand:+ start:1291 stop:2502 length:1212 start_codon:yes stop_codon:yes gene_type:complete